MKYRTLIIVAGILLVSGCLIFTYYSVSNSPDIRVAYISSDHEAAFMVAMAQNTYQKEGLKVKSTQMSSGSDVIAAIASGDVDVGYVGIVPALQGISQGVPIKIVGAVNLDGSGIVVDPKSNITNISDLKGKKIASPGVSSIQQVLLLYELQKYNLTANDTDILSVNIFMIPNTLASDKVDAYIAYEPFVSLAPYRGMGRVLMYSQDIIPDHPCCVIVARQDYIDNHPQQLQKFLDIHKNTTEYVQTHQNETAYLISQEMTTNPDVEKTALSHVVFVYKVDPAFQENVLNFMKIEQELGYSKVNLTTDQIFNTRFLGG